MAEQVKTVLSVKKDTPQWAKWTYRIVFAVTTGAAFIIASDNHIEPELRIRIGLYLKGFDMIIYTILQGFGVQKYEKAE